MEYANFGFSSNDGQRTWQADRRPGQSVPVAEWRQDDPGMMPAGDVYGGGSPTGNVFYENGALGPSWEGTFFAADAGRNEVFSYQPARAGRGLRARTEGLPDLEREAAIRRVRLRRRAAHGVTSAIATLFRPSDVAVGPDGALYVSDWIDARVGGHQDLDDTLSGAIYRIAPKGFVSKVPTFDAATIDGLITALRSPAVNVRAIGFDGLKARGASAVDAVAALLNDPSPYMRGRAIYLLYQLGPEGRQRAGTPESYTDPALRIAAYRAMRRAGLDVLPVAARLARDTDPGVRREVARVACAISRPTTSLDILVDIARGFDGQDRSYLEALGTGATGKEPALYERLHRELGVNDDPIAWPADVHVDRVAAARAGGGAGPVGARASRRSCRSPTAGSRSIRSPSSTIRPRRRRCSSFAQPDSPLREPATRVAVEPHVERLGGLTACGRRSRRPESTIPTRSTLREAVVPPAAGGSARALDRRDRPPHRRRRARQEHGDALPDVPRDRRHRRRARSGARRLGTRQVGRRDRHGASSARAPRSRTATRARRSRRRTG